MSDQTETARPEAPRTSRAIGSFILGGAIMATGFGAAWYLQDGKIQALRSDMAQIDSQLGELDSRIAQIDTRFTELPEPDLAPLEAKIAPLGEKIAALDEQNTGILSQLSEMGEKISANELLASGGAQDASSASSYVAEVEARLSQLETNAASITEASAQIRAEADAAEAAARAAEARAALSQIRTALENGSPFDSALPALEAQTEIPAALRDVAAEGVTTMADLRAELPALSRAALAAARESGTSNEDLSGLSGFLSKQFELRSTTVRDGDSADAVLSRISAATTADDLESVLSEAGTLPDPARDVLGDWLGAAQTRHNAAQAVTALTQRINQE